MSSRTLINDFLAQRNIALIRSSRKAPVAGVRIDKQLAPKGYNVSVVYLDETDPGSKLSGLKSPVEGVIIAVSQELCEKAVREAIEARAPRIWLQQGSESKRAISLCKENNIPVIHDECVLMYAEPVKSIHAFHRWVWKKLGRLSV